MRATTPILILFGTCLLLGNCTKVYFEHPQPEQGEVLNQFPEALQGVYLYDEDTLRIVGEAYTYPDLIEGSLPVSQLDSLPGVTLRDGRLFDQSLPVSEGVVYKIINDTLYYSLNYRLYNYLSDSLILKIYKNWYVLNEREDKNGYWKVYLIKPTRQGSLVLYSVGNFLPPDERKLNRRYDGILSDFFSITEFKKLENDEYLINPTERELTQLIRRGFFVKNSELQRIK